MIFTCFNFWPLSYFCLYISHLFFERLSDYAYAKYVRQFVLLAKALLYATISPTTKAGDIFGHTFWTMKFVELHIQRQV